MPLNSKSEARAEEASKTGINKRKTFIGRFVIYPLHIAPANE
jgi:hypothetical protein